MRCHLICLAQNISVNKCGNRSACINSCIVCGLICLQKSSLIETTCSWSHVYMYAPVGWSKFISAVSERIGDGLPYAFCLEKSNYCRIIIIHMPSFWKCVFLPEIGFCLPSLLLHKFVGDKFPVLAFKIPTCTGILGRRDCISLIHHQHELVLRIPSDLWHRHTYIQSCILLIISRLFCIHTHWDKTYSSLLFQILVLIPKWKLIK